MTLSLMLMLAAMVFWGSWTNASRLTRHWRLELFHFDCSVGLAAIALAAAALAPGVAANMRGADGAAVLWAVLGGAALNAGNFLLVAGIARVGMTVAFPVAVGLSLVVSTLLSYLVKPQGNAALLAAGVAMVFGAVATNAAAYRAMARTPRGTARGGGLAMCFAAGILFSACGPLVAMALTAPRPLAPLAAGALYALGSLGAAVPLLGWLGRHPVDGGPFRLHAYTEGSLRNHAAGWLGGAVWGAGMLCNFIAAGDAGMAVAGAVAQANPLVAAVWGIVVWREFRGAPRRTFVLLAAMLALYGGGLLLLAWSA